MKTTRIYMLALAGTLACGAGYAQDDVYFVPSRKAATTATTQQPTTMRSSYENIATDGSMDYDNWYEGRTDLRDVDAYNRRTVPTDYDTIDDSYVPDEYYMNDEPVDGLYTSRIVRFHSPRGVIVASPYYWDYYDTYYYDPWWGWRSSWYSPWYSGWYGGWYSPWYSWSWYGHGWYGGWSAVI